MPTKHQHFQYQMVNILRCNENKPEKLKLTA